MHWLGQAARRSGLPYFATASGSRAGASPEAALLGAARAQALRTSTLSPPSHAGGLGKLLVCLGLGLGGAATMGCGSAPQSMLPSAADALARMRATLSCSRGVQGDASLDYFSDEGRVTGSVLYYAMLPEQLRFDVVSPFGVTISTLTSDGRDFSLYDLQNKQFLYGPANACNVGRFTRVPVPPFALAQLLHGEAPVLVHEASQASLKWDSGFFGGGHYTVQIASKHQAFEEIHLAPVPDDFDKPWQEQRLRVLSVEVQKQGVSLYVATLRDHEVTRTKPAEPDPDGLGPALPPSGPECRAEVPRSLRIRVPSSGQDVVFRNREQWHNPPHRPGVFQQRCPSGMSCRFVDCQVPR